MTWEETIKYIRTQPDYKNLIKFAYFEEDLKLNVERFKQDQEFLETKQLIASLIPFSSSLKLLDIGSGNGITSVAFALEGIQVDCVEPDPSDTIGAGAIRKLKDLYKLSNLSVYESFAEELKFPDHSFDIVYSRQCMHHAHDLQQFLKECYRVLKKGGILLTIRDHVIFSETDKKWFLETHPLQKFYGGENAYRPQEYRSAMLQAGFEIKKELKHFDTIINFFPLTMMEKEKRSEEFEKTIQTIVKKKLGVCYRLSVFRKMASAYVRKKLIDPFDEQLLPGRMYSYIAIKK